MLVGSARFRNNKMGHRGLQKFMSNHTLISKLQSDQVSAMFSKKEKNTSNLTPITVYVKYTICF